MKIRTGTRRFLSLLMALVMVLSLLPALALAEDEEAASVTYKKVTTAPDDWSGEYLLVYEAGNAALDGSLTTIDAAKNYKVITINDDSITVPDHSISVFLEAVEGGYVLKAANGQYLYHSSDANKISTTTNQSTAANYPITLTVGSDGIDIVLSVGAHMRFNVATDQMRFRFYKSSTYGSQQPVTLYKLEEGTATPTVASPVVTPAAGEVEARTKVTLSCATEAATIYYTTDGSKPTTDSMKYAVNGDGIAIDNACTIKAIAVKDGVCSSVAEFAYTIKTAELTGFPLLGEVKAGDIVTIYCASGKKVMTNKYHFLH